MPQDFYNGYFLTKSMALKSAKKLPFLGIHHKVIPYPRAYYPTYTILPEESSRH